MKYYQLTHYHMDLVRVSGKREKLFSISSARRSVSATLNP